MFRATLIIAAFSTVLCCFLASNEKDLDAVSAGALRGGQEIIHEDSHCSDNFNCIGVSKACPAYTSVECNESREVTFPAWTGKLGCKDNEPGEDTACKLHGWPTVCRITRVWCEWDPEIGVCVLAYVGTTNYYSPRWCTTIE